MPCFSSDFFPLFLASISGSCSQQLLLWCLPNGAFLFYFLLHVFIEFLVQERAVGFPQLFIYLFKYLCHYDLWILILSYWLKSNTVIIYFHAEIFPTLVIRRSFELFSLSFMKSLLSYLSTSYFVASQDAPSSDFFFSCPRPGIQHFSENGV